MLFTLFAGGLKECALIDFAIESFVAALKKYLYELRTPLIPVNFYDRFLEAARKYTHSMASSVLTSS